MTPSPETHLLREIQAAFRRQKAQAERAFDQLPDDRWTTRLGDPDGDGNSVSVLVRHLAGNLRSRWLAPFDADGERPDRDRDGEFEDREMAPVALRRAWEDAWEVALRTIDAPRP